MTFETPSSMFERRHAATDRASIVVVPERRMLAVDGVGSPTASGYRLATETLHTAAEILRTRLSRTRRINTQISVIECSWWTEPEPAPDEMAAKFADRSRWHWRAMIEIPEAASDEDALAAIDETRRRASRVTPLLRLTRLAGGRSAQILHTGGPAAEPEAVAKLHAAIREAGLRPHGHLHELHIAEPGRVPESRVRTILRLHASLD